MLATVVINVLDGEKHIQSAIKSVLSQTHTNLELVILDNNSSDNTFELACKFAQQDQRVRVRKSEFTIPLYAARNVALEGVRGEFIAFLDCDDVWIPKKLEVALSSLAQTNADVFYSNFIKWDSVENTLTRAYHAKLPSGDIFRHLISNYTVALSTLVFRRQALIGFEGPPFNENYSIIGDYDLVLRSAAQLKFAATDECLVLIQDHGANLSKVRTDLRHVEAQIWCSDDSLHGLLGEENHQRASRALELDVLLSECKTRGRLGTVSVLLFQERQLLKALFAKLEWQLRNLVRRMFTPKFDSQC